MTPIPGPCYEGWTQTYDGYCVSMDEAGQVYLRMDYGGGYTGGEPLEVCTPSWSWFPFFKYNNACLSWNQIIAGVTEPPPPPPPTETPPPADCPAGFTRDAAGFCQPDACPDGYYRDVTGQCVQAPPVPGPYDIGNFKIPWLYVGIGAGVLVFLGIVIAVARK